MYKIHYTVRSLGTGYRHHSVTAHSETEKDRILNDFKKHVRVTIKEVTKLTAA